MTPEELLEKVENLEKRVGDLEVQVKALGAVPVPEGSD